MENIQQHLTIGDASYHWMVDITTIARIAVWAKRHPDALRADLRGMALYFPHWLLAGSRDGRPARCEACMAPCVPRGGSVRCAVCGKTTQADGLIWIGSLPAIARPEPVFMRRRVALRDAGFTEVQAGDVTYLLAPFTISYPAEWPNVEPVVRYAGRWLDALGLPRFSGAHHLIDNGRACLYS